MLKLVPKARSSRKFHKNKSNENLIKVKGMPKIRCFAFNLPKFHYFIHISRNVDQ